MHVFVIDTLVTDFFKKKFYLFVSCCYIWRAGKGRYKRVTAETLQRCKVAAGVLDACDTHTQGFCGMEIGPAGAARLCNHDSCFTLLLSSPALFPRWEVFVSSHLSSQPCQTLRLCSVSRGLCWSPVSGRRGAQLPTQQTVNLRPPPSGPGSHLLFGPLATCRGHRSGRLLTLLVLTTMLTPPSLAISGCPLKMKTRVILLRAPYLKFWFACAPQIGTSMELHTKHLLAK